MRVFFHHTSDLFDYDNCATLESQFCKGVQCDVEDNTAVAQARQQLANSTNADNYVALGDALCKQLRYRQAIDCYDQALAMDSNHRLAHRRRAIRYLTLLRTREAYKAFCQCQTMGFDALDCLYRLALCCYYEGQFERCQQLMTECIPLCHTNNEMHVAVVYWLALSLIRQGKSYTLALDKWNGSTDVGHHLGYLYLLQLLSTGKKPQDNMHPLTQCIYQYGEYCLMLHKDNKRQANAFLQQYLVNNKTYWGSFAYLAALSDVRGNFAQQGEYPTLQDFFAKYNKVAVAFSGGVDSAYLLYNALQCGAEVHAYFVKTQFQPQFELDDAQRVAQFCGVRLNILNVDALTNSVVANDSNRCYYCKQTIMSNILQQAAQQSCMCVVEGTNATDDVADRAGFRALQELGVFSPLRICGIGKQEIRRFAHKAGLPNAHKVSYACLATRIATNSPITEVNIELVNKAEEELRKVYKLKVFRVRLDGHCARLQSCASEIESVKANWQNIQQTLLKYVDKAELSDSLHGEE